MTKRPHDPNYLDGSRDIPLFPVTKAMTKRGTERRKKAPTAAWALCPMHTNAGTRTGLIHVGEHLVWIVHYAMVGRSSIPCRSSGSALCVCEPTDHLMRIFLKPDERNSDNGMRPGECPHTTKERRLSQTERRLSQTENRSKEVDKNASRQNEMRNPYAMPEGDPFDV